MVAPNTANVEHSVWCATVKSIELRFYRKEAVCDHFADDEISTDHRAKGKQFVNSDFTDPPL
jgi:hypothetical protein